MSLWVPTLAVVVAGAIGGAGGALLSEDRRSVLPTRVPVDHAGSLLRPGLVGHMLVGALAAFLSWGLYGPFAGEDILGGSRTHFGLPLAALAGAVGVGLGGAKWLANYVDKVMLRGAATLAAAQPASPELALKIAAAPPSAALRLAGGTAPKEQEHASEGGLQPAPAT